MLSLHDTDRASTQKVVRECSYSIKLPFLAIRVVVTT
jgi:hypothetical protein